MVRTHHILHIPDLFIVISEVQGSKDAIEAWDLEIKKLKKTLEDHDRTQGEVETVRATAKFCNHTLVETGIPIHGNNCDIVRD